MIAEWKDRLLKAARRSTEAEEKEFLLLVDEVGGVCSLETARILMKTFSERPDYGTQERVVSVLTGGDERDMMIALLEELPRLAKDAPRWADALTGEKVEFQPMLLAQIASTMPVDVKKALRSILADPDFRELFHNARNIAF